MDKVKVMKVARLAKKFLSIADELNEKVSRYFDGSKRPEDAKAYETVRAASDKFTDALNELWGERYQYGLNYELAECFLYGM